MNNDSERYPLNINFEEDMLNRLRPALRNFCTIHGLPYDIATDLLKYHANLLDKDKTEWLEKFEKTWTFFLATLKDD